MLLHDDFLLYQISSKLIEVTCVWCRYRAIASTYPARQAFEKAHAQHCRTNFIHLVKYA